MWNLCNYHHKHAQGVLERRWKNKFTHHLLMEVKIDNFHGVVVTVPNFVLSIIWENIYNLVADKSNNGFC
jgi:hypothetical protein